MTPLDLENRILGTPPAGPAGARSGQPQGARSTAGPSFGDILRKPETRERLQFEAAEPREMEPEEMRRFIRDEVRKWTDVAKAARIHVN